MSGEPVSTNYQPVTVRLPLRVKVRLDAMTAGLKLSRWRVIVSALGTYFDSLPDADRELITALERRHGRRVESYPKP